MWHWRQRLPESALGFVCAGVVGVGHGVALSFLFMHWYGETVRVLITGMPVAMQARVVVLPFHKKVSVAGRDESGALPRAASTHKASQKQGAATTLCEKKKEQKSSYEVKKSLPVKKQAVPKKNKKTEPSKKLPEPKPVVRPAQHKAQPVPPCAEPPPAPSRVPDLSRVDELVQTPTVGPQVREQDEALLAAEAESVVYMGSAEYEAYQLESQLYAQAVELWKPPYGLAKHFVCQVSVQIGHAGEIVRYGVLQSSGALVYDMSVRSAVFAVVFPRAAYGKEIVLTFKYE